MTALEAWPQVVELPVGDRQCPVCGNYPSACTCRIGDGSPRSWPRTPEQAAADRRKHAAGKHRRAVAAGRALDLLLGVENIVLGRPTGHVIIDDRPVCGRCGTLLDPDGTCYPCAGR